MPAHSEPHPFHPTVTRYYDARGRRCTSSTPGARKATEKLQTYSADLPRPGMRPERVNLGTAVESEAWEKLRAILERRAREAEGLFDPALAHARKTLTEHVEEWLSVVAADGACHRHVQQLRHDVNKLAALAGWTRLQQIERDSISLALGKLTAAGTAAQTRNHALAHLKQFVRWAHEGGRIASNPAGAVRPMNVEADRRRVRREPTTLEVGQLWAYLARPGSPAISGIPGPARALCYKVAMATGLRSAEVASLTDDSFDLAEGVVRVQAGYSKRRRLDVQRLPTWLLTELRAWRAGGGLICWRFAENRPGLALKADLEACGVPYVVDGLAGPSYFDFHALRHWYCAQLAAQPGIDLKTLTELCRHSTPVLTLKTYGHLRETAARAAVEAIPAPGGKPSGHSNGHSSGAAGLQNGRSESQAPADGPVRLWTAEGA